MLKLENSLIDKGYHCIIGIDEVGRGPAAGPMVFCGVRYIKELEAIDGLTDSKKLTDKKRRQILHELNEIKVDYQIGIVWPEEIDKHGLSDCSKLAMSRLLRNFEATGFGVDFILMDGNLKVPDKYLFTDNKSIIKGDSKCLCIAAASIIAKEFRDEMMKLYSHDSPFSYNRHKAYLTKLHKEEIRQHGLERIHRKSYNISL